MMLNGFSNNCGAKIITGLGSGDRVAWPGGSYLKISDRAKKIHSWAQTCKQMGDGLIVATTNSTQRQGNAALRAVGFKKVRTKFKGHHETNFYLWHLDVKKWDENKSATNIRNLVDKKK